MTQIYLVSPQNFRLADFTKELDAVLKTGLIPVFQLRIKNCQKSEIIAAAKEIKKICSDNNCLFILNDDYELAFHLGLGGAHLGADDGSIAKARKMASQDFVIGASCYDSRHLAMMAGQEGANYISFGAFFESKTKVSRGKPTPDIIRWAAEIMNLPVCAIGGINNENCKILKDAGTDFVAVISYVWQNSLGAKKAVEILDGVLKD